MAPRPPEARRPRVLLHFAQTLDGRIADRDGGSQWISGPESLCLAHELRASHDAVLVGVGTVLRDNPRLTVRLVEGTSPRRVVLDSRLRTPDSAAVLQERAEQTIFLTTSAAPAVDVERVQRRGARVLVLPADDQDRVDLRLGLELLCDQQIRSLLVEGGARVITELLRQRLADRLVVCVAPLLLGAGVDAIGDLDIPSLGQALSLRRLEVRQLGDDLILSGDLSGEPDPPDQPDGDQRNWRTSTFPSRSRVS